ncbi:rRNA pseudouridine synthase [Lactococcus raffinolactis]|uniref:pseudouridine synthase n=1 Tax=Pseudolactococcus raffinolactis TaxID=1366 RepID=UPI001C708E91|nr:pseudouridine synthase [Lactococcus raffinolactis]MBW9330020.1 rRNA pseudouridine synthase [Lactococcus raffinolactis]
MRINKYLAHAGVASRRKAEELIKAGDVTVNGDVMTDLAYQVKSGDTVEVKQTQIYKEEPVYYVLNKPRGVISSVSDEKDRKTVMDFFRHIPERIYPVGRLDWDTSGLILMTNDGEFANLMTHPRHEIEKVYIAKVEGQANKENLRPLTQGVKIDGRKTKPAIYQIIKQDISTKKSVVQLTIREGRNHQVKKMFEAVGLPVQKLSRVQYGTLDLTGLQPGEFRRLSKKEVSQLVNAAKGI